MGIWGSRASLSSLSLPLLDAVMSPDASPRSLFVEKLLQYIMLSIYVFLSKLYTQHVLKCLLTSLILYTYLHVNGFQRLWGLTLMLAKQEKMMLDFVEQKYYYLVNLSFCLLFFNFCIDKRAVAKSPSFLWCFSSTSLCLLLPFLPSLVF
mgnify:CR=1 FL=1